MSIWSRSSVSLTALCRLVAATDAEEWRVPKDETVPRPLKGYVVSFVVFHDCCFSVLAGRFIRAVLFEYGLQL